MKNLRNIIFAASFITIVVCVGLFITKFDPSNPTHRRYSSDTVLSTGDAPADEIGRSGEDTLSTDLKLARNEDNNPILAICNTRFKSALPPAKNTECFYFSDEIENYRVPDFVSDNFIAESKNARDLLDTQERNLKQIQAFALAAKDLEIPLYIYVRNDTRVDKPYHNLFTDEVEGGVIYYFRTKYHPFDQQDVILLLVIIANLCVMLIWVFFAKLMSRITQLRPKPQPKSPIAISEHRKSRKARQSFDDYDNFVRDAKDHARRTLDDD